MNLTSEAEEVKSLEGRISHLEASLAESRQEQQKSQDTLEHSKEAQEILQLLAQSVQQQAHSRISRAVSSCLESIFEDPYELKIEFERKRGRTEARLRFLRRGLAVDPLTASGGGMVDVAAFAMRVACLSFHRPPLSRIVVLDEAFKFVSQQYRKNIRGMLEELSHSMNLQIIQVTHSPEYESGKIIEI